MEDADDQPQSSESAAIPAEDEIMSKATKLIRCVRSLVHTTNLEMGMPVSSIQEDIAQRRVEWREQRMQMRQMLRGGIGLGEVEEIAGQHEAEEESRPECVCNFKEIMGGKSSNFCGRLPWCQFCT